LSFKVAGKRDSQETTINFSSPGRGEIRIAARFTNPEWDALSNWSAIMPAAITRAILKTVLERKEESGPPDFAEIFQTLRQ
jgi:hypothetical protein